MATSYNPFSLEGKTILVTGASSGIGQTTAIECSKLGAKVVITGRNVERLQETFSQLDGDGHLQVAADLSEVDGITALVEAVPSLDGLVLCAGRPMTSPFQFNTPDKYEDVFKINFFSPVELLRLLLKKKKINKGGSVVFISSIGGVQRCTYGNSVYGASKAAIVSTMRFCALELAPKKIRVNTVNPGMTNTKLIHAGTISDEQLKANMEANPLKRYAETIDIAHGIIYLLSDAASYVTGQSLVIDGGTSI